MAKRAAQPLTRWNGPVVRPSLVANSRGQCYVHVDGVRVCWTLAHGPDDGLLLVLRDLDPRKATARGTNLVAVSLEALRDLLREI